MTAPFIIDAHAHLGPTQAFEAYHGGMDAMIAAMDLLHIETTIFSAMPSLENEFEEGYRLSIEAMERFPGRFRAYAVFNPNWLEPSMHYIERLMAHPGFAGIKIHPAMHAMDPIDARYQPLWEMADEHKLAVLAHTWSPDPAKPVQNLSVPERFAPVLERYTRLRVILGHFGGRDVGMRQAIALMNAYSHCYADLSGDCWEMGQLEWLCAQTDPSRILFGTDMNWIEGRYVFGHVLKARLSPEIKLAIFRENALRLFGG